MSNAIKQQSHTFVEYGHRTEYAFFLFFSPLYLYFVTILIGRIDRVVGTHAHRNYIWYLVSAKMPHHHFLFDFLAFHHNFICVCVCWFVESDQHHHRITHVFYCESDCNKIITTFDWRWNEAANVKNNNIVHERHVISAGARQERNEYTDGWAGWEDGKWTEK